MTVHRTFPLADYEPGEYTLEVKVTDSLAGTVTVSSARFTVRRYF
jgi:hypothetical protein